MTNSTVDGLGGDEVNQNVTNTAIISGGKVFATTYIETTGSIIAQGIIYSSSDVYANGNKLPLIQAGSNVTGTGSLVWTSYPISYITAPQVLVQIVGEQAGMAVGSIGVGSFITYSVGAAKNFTWISLG